VPDQPPGLELYKLALGDLRKYWDVEGRPLVEDRTGMGESPTRELKRCPYAGSRQGRMMNVSALRQLGGHWQEVLGGFERIAAAHAAKNGIAKPALVDWLLVAQMAVTLPYYLLSRAHAPVANRELPAFAALLAKTAFDIATTCKLVLARSVAGGSVPSDVAQIAEVAEESRLFLHGASGACAGSPKQIDEVLYAIALREPHPLSQHPLDGLLPETAPFLDYAYAYARVDLLVLLLRVEATFALRRIRDLLPDETFAEEKRLLQSGLDEVNTQARLAELIADLVAEAGDRPALIAGLFRAIDRLATTDAAPASSAVVQIKGEGALLRMASASERGRALPRPALEAMVAILFEYLSFERDVLSRLEVQQRSANRLLGRGSARAPEGSDVSRLMRTPLSIASMLFEIRILTRRDRAVLAAKDETVEL
jgi:hypothetical protein